MPIFLKWGFEHSKKNYNIVIDRFAGYKMEHDKLRLKLNELILEHGDLNDAIRVLAEGPNADQLQLKRMKKRKLKIKDEIALLESKLIPDIKA